MMQTSNNALVQAIATLLQQKQQPAPLSVANVSTLVSQCSPKGVMSPTSISNFGNLSHPLPSQPMAVNLQQLPTYVNGAVAVHSSVPATMPSQSFAPIRLASAQQAPQISIPNKAHFDMQLKSVAEQIARLQSLQSDASQGFPSDTIQLGFPRANSGPPLSNCMGQDARSNDCASPSSVSDDTTVQSVTSSSDKQEQGSAPRSKKVRKIFPRRKTGEAQRNNHSPVMLNEFVLAEYFDMPLLEASKKLGICQTTLKKTCRKFGITKWPYKTRRLESPPNIKERA